MKTLGLPHIYIYGKRLVMELIDWYPLLSQIQILSISAIGESSQPCSAPPIVCSFSLYFSFFLILVFYGFCLSYRSRVLDRCVELLNLFRFFMVLCILCSHGDFFRKVWFGNCVRIGLTAYPVCFLGDLLGFDSMWV